MVLGVAAPVNRQMLLAWLLQAANTAPQSLMALDLFLGRPQRDYGMIPADQKPELPVRNLRPVRKAG